MAYAIRKSENHARFTRRDTAHAYTHANEYNFDGDYVRRGTAWLGWPGLVRHGLFRIQFIFGAARTSAECICA